MTIDPTQTATEQRLLKHLAARIRQGAPLVAGGRGSVGFLDWHAHTLKTLQAIFGLDSPAVSDFEAFLQNDEDPIFYLRSLHQLLTEFEGASTTDKDVVDQYTTLKNMLTEFKRFMDRPGEESFVKDTVLEKKVRRRVHQIASMIYQDVQLNDVAAHQNDIRIQDIKTALLTQVVVSKESYLRVRETMLIGLKRAKEDKSCKRALIFVYDPLFFMKNPFGLIGDVTLKGAFPVDLIISPQPFLKEGG